MLYSSLNKFDSSSVIDENKFVSEIRVFEDEETMAAFFEVLKDQGVICRRIGCTNLQDNQHDNIIQISFSLLNLFIKFEGLINVNFIHPENEVTILIDGELQFTSNSYKSPIQLTTEIKAAWENSDNKKWIFLQSNLESQIIGFANHKLGSSITISTLENVQSNLINRLLYNNI